MYSINKNKTTESSPEIDFNKLRSISASNLNLCVRCFLIHNTHFGLIHNHRLLSRSLYAFDGSIIVTGEQFDKYAPQFFKRSRRHTFYRSRFHLRGGRYIISTNPTFELRQKLDTFSEDLIDAIDALKTEKVSIYRLVLSDYIKNCTITILNSFLHDEKLGKYRFTDHIYQSLRKDGIEYATHAVNMYYMILIGNNELALRSFKYIDKNIITFERMQRRILKAYESGTFSSRHITRPEASHPLNIASAAGFFAAAGPKNIDTIIGIPSGSTELALAHRVCQQYVNRRQCELGLFPISLHSSKIEFDTNPATVDTWKHWATENSRMVQKKNVLIVDDNSSTGRTIETVAGVLKNQKPNSTHVAVAEMDLIRSKIDLNNASRSNISSLNCYKYSIGVLPVSKIISPKRDLKEIFEERKMLECTKNRFLKSKSISVKRLIGHLYCDLIQNRTEKVLNSIEKNQVIYNFRHTFLSNFHPVDIEYEGGLFHSVEHAYQAMKFDPKRWSEITDSEVEAINRRLAPRGAEIRKDLLPALFSDPNVSAGTSKIAANELRIRGYVREDWDDVKTEIMTELLIQKFAVPELKGRLDATGERYLIEGNDWNDTYWGVCNERGRNVLGRLLMIIRKSSLQELRDLTELVRTRSQALPAF